MPTISSPFGIVVHATHEAGVKVGGIGSVLNGLLSTRAYNERVARTILVGPVDTADRTAMGRLVASDQKLQLRYSSFHRVDHLETVLGDRLRAIEAKYGVKLLYGIRAFGSAWHEIVLVDPIGADPEQVNRYKARLYREFGIQSDRYEHDPEYSFFVDAAEPAYAALEAVLGKGSSSRFMIAHEFMGLPLCYSAILDDPRGYRTIFYGHEVATVRPLVESHPGHDTMFYNVLARAQEAGLYLEDVFGDQSAFFKHALILPAARHCDGIFAVGDAVVQEMRFLDSGWRQAPIDLVYNGVTSHEITLDEKRASKLRLQRYCQNLLGFDPDYVFAHVTRLVLSKGLWRDLRVMEHLDKLLAQDNKRAVLFVLSTVLPAGRPPEAIWEMESLWNWPVKHREAPIVLNGETIADLISHEVPFYRAIDEFNRTAEAAQIVFINQFGWNQERCGRRMPADMTFADLRQGCDLEFGQSIYEPFGIAQVEPLGFGALCVISTVCGCLSFIRQTGGPDHPCIVAADYVDTVDLPEGLQGALEIGVARRDRIELAESGRIAREIARRLPADDVAAHRLLAEGYTLSQRMSWDVVAREYLLPALERVNRA